MLLKKDTMTPAIDLRIRKEIQRILNWFREDMLERGVFVEGSESGSKPRFHRDKYIVNIGSILRNIKVMGRSNWKKRGLVENDYSLNINFEYYSPSLIFRRGDLQMQLPRGLYMGRGSYCKKDFHTSRHHPEARRLIWLADTWAKEHSVANLGEFGYLIFDEKNILEEFEAGCKKIPYYLIWTEPERIREFLFRT